MSAPTEVDRVFAGDGGSVRSLEFTESTSGKTWDIHIKDNGVNDASNKYLDLGTHAYFLQLRTDKDLTIEQINHVDVTPTVITIPGEGEFTRRFGVHTHLRFTTSGSTQIKLLVFGGSA